jgi:hypothetical protein
MKRLIFVLAVVVAAAGGTFAVASSTEQQAHGTLTSQQLAGPACASPVAFCITGKLTGVFNGDYVLTVTSLQPSSTPGVFFYNGTVVDETSKGEVRCSDAGVYSFADPHGPIVDLCTITSGTGDWAGVSGHLRLHGTFTPAGGGSSHYEGLITH